MTITLLDLATKAAKCGVAITRYQISREDAARVREAEKVGHNHAVKVLLEILFKKPNLH